MIFRNLFRAFSSKAKTNLKYGHTAPLKPYVDSIRTIAPGERDMVYPDSIVDDPRMYSAFNLGIFMGIKKRILKGLIQL